MKSKKEIVRKFELLAQIRADLKAWEKAEPDFDDNYFDEWVIIDDIREGGSDEGAV